MGGGGHYRPTVNSPPNGAGALGQAANAAGFRAHWAAFPPRGGAQPSPLAFFALEAVTFFAAVFLPVAFPAVVLAAAVLAVVFFAAVLDAAVFLAAAVLEAAVFFAAGALEAAFLAGFFAVPAASAGAPYSVWEAASVWALSSVFLRG